MTSTQQQSRSVPSKPPAQPPETKARGGMRARVRGQTYDEQVQSLAPRVRIIPIVEPHPDNPKEQTWLAINADTGGVAFILGPEHNGRKAADLALGTQEAMTEVDRSDPDLLPAPANLKKQLIQPVVMANPHGDHEVTWVATDAGSGKALYAMGDEYQGKNARSLAVGTKAASYIYWSIDSKDGETTIGNTGAEHAATMYDEARKDAAGTGQKGPPKNLAHLRYIPIVEPHPNRPSEKTWLAINVNTGGVAFVMGEERKGRAAADLPYGTQEPAEDMYMVEMADGSTMGFVGEEHAKEALAVAAKEESAGAKMADFPDMKPAPAGLRRQVVEPVVMNNTVGDHAQTWMAVDLESGKVMGSLTDDYQGKNAKSLPLGTKEPPYIYWSCDDGDATVGAIGEEQAGSMYDVAAKKDRPAFTPSNGVVTGGPQLAQVQERLSGLGYACGAADGIMGPKTRAAVVQFQRDKGLVADGIIGPKTQAAMV